MTDALKARIRHVPDFPKPGILFYDVTTLLRDPEGFRIAIDQMAAPFARGADRSGGGHREPRVHSRQRGGRPPRRRVRAGAQAGQAAGRDHPAPATRSSTAPTASRCTAMPSPPGSGCSSSTTCSRPGGTASATVQLVKQLRGVVTGLAFLIELVGLERTVEARRGTGPRGPVLLNCAAKIGCFAVAPVAQQDRASVS